MSRLARLIPIKIPPQRVVHIWAFIACFALASIYLWAIPDTRKDSNQIFSTITGWVTIYAAFFAMIEIARLRSASELAKASADTATYALRTKILAATQLRLLLECQFHVDSAISAIDTKRAISSTQVNNLIKSYRVCIENESEAKGTDDERMRLETVNQLKLFDLTTTAKDRESAGKYLRPHLFSMSDHISRSIANVTSPNNQ